MTQGVSGAEGQRPQPFRRLRSIGGRSGVDVAYLERVETELVLLREENARLRLERAQRPGAGPMIERLKTLSTCEPPDQDHRDEAWHLISQALVMRDVLIDVCKEIGQTTTTLQTRLSDLAPDLADRVGDVRAQPVQRRAPAAHERQVLSTRHTGAVTT
ncbi:MAG: hypothetical protein QOD83_2756 [Solirubrobacteraceae bacterium]|jgi:hypothetical protein|nr:hypothetical protein [Solirubrobacteraceae bacterium]